MQELNLLSLWHQGDGVIRFTALILLTLSVLSWTVIFYKVIQFFVHSKRLSQNDSSHCYARVIERFLQEQCATLDVLKHTNPTAFDEALNILLQGFLSKHHLRLAKGLGLLATTGAIAPFIGLFGTVWGIYHAMLGLSIQQSSSITAVAAPIGEALIMTAFGLVVAVPAIFASNLLVRWQQRLDIELQTLINQKQVWLTLKEHSQSK